MSIQEEWGSEHEPLAFVREDRGNELKTVDSEMKSGTTAAKARGSLLTSEEGEGCSLGAVRGSY
jgi:hypothetical protein